MIKKRSSRFQILQQAKHANNRDLDSEIQLERGIWMNRKNKFRKKLFINLLQNMSVFQSVTVLNLSVMEPVGFFPQKAG